LSKETLVGKKSIKITAALVFVAMLVLVVFGVSGAEEEEPAKLDDGGGFVIFGLDQLDEGLRKIKEGVDEDAVPALEQLIYGLDKELVAGLEEMPTAVEEEMVPGIEEIIETFEKEGPEDDPGVLQGLEMIIEGTGESAEGLGELKEGLQVHRELVALLADRAERAQFSAEPNRQENEFFDLKTADYVISDDVGPADIGDDDWVGANCLFFMVFMDVQNAQEPDISFSVIPPDDPAQMDDFEAYEVEVERRTSWYNDFLYKHENIIDEHFMSIIGDVAGEKQPNPEDVAIAAGTLFNIAEQYVLEYNLNAMIDGGEFVFDPEVVMPKVEDGELVERGYVDFRPPSPLVETYARFPASYPIMIDGLSEGIAGIEQDLRPGVKDMHEGFEEELLPGLKEMHEGITREDEENPGLLMGLNMMHEGLTGVDEEVADKLEGKDYEEIVAAVPEREPDPDVDPGVVQALAELRYGLDNLEFDPETDGEDEMGASQGLAKALDGISSLSWLMVGIILGVAIIGLLVGFFIGRAIAQRSQFSA